MNKYDSEDLRNLIKKHISTHTQFRATSTEVFNRDGQYMVDLKQIYYDQLQRSLSSGSSQEQMEADLIMLFLQSENKRLRLKHWPNSQNK